MGLKRNIASILSAALLGFGVSAAAVAQDGQTGQVPVSVQVGAAPDAGLSWLIVETSPFPPVQSSFETQTTTGGMTATVSDTRGTRAGWTLSVSANDFTGANTGDTIQIGNLTIAPGSIQVIAGQASPLPAVNTITMSSTPRTLMSAATGTGAGRYTVPLNGTLTIPGGTRVDTYSTTITVDLAAAP